MDHRIDRLTNCRFGNALNRLNNPASSRAAHSPDKIFTHRWAQASMAQREWGKGPRRRFLKQGLRRPMPEPRVRAGRLSAGRHSVRC
jgi:hypothetical protein